MDTLGAEQNSFIFGETVFKEIYQYYDLIFKTRFYPTGQTLIATGIITEIKSSTPKKFAKMKTDDSELNFSYESEKLTKELSDKFLLKNISLKLAIYRDPVGIANTKPRYIVISTTSIPIPVQTTLESE